MSMNAESKSTDAKTFHARQGHRTIPVSKQFFGYAEQKWITCGSTQVLVRTPTAQELKKRIREANAVVEGLMRALTKRRKKNTFKPTTPLFQSDPVDPRFVIRTLNKKKLRGTFVDGIFLELP